MITVLLITSIIMPAGAWAFLALAASGKGYIIVIIPGLIAMAYVATFPRKRTTTKTRLLLCSVIAVATIFVVASFMDLGVNALRRMGTCARCTG